MQTNFSSPLPRGTDIEEESLRFQVLPLDEDLEATRVAGHGILHHDVLGGGPLDVGLPARGARLDLGQGLTRFRVAGSPDEPSREGQHVTVRDRPREPYARGAPTEPLDPHASTASRARYP
jgi:hypothetical protein